MSLRDDINANMQPVMEFSGDVIQVQIVMGRLKDGNLATSIVGVVQNGSGSRQLKSWEARAILLDAVGAQLRAEGQQTDPVTLLHVARA